MFIRAHRRSDVSLLCKYAFQKKNSCQEVQTVQSETRLEAVLSRQPHEPQQNATG